MARSLLVTEEMRLKSKALALPADSSSPMVLMADLGNTRRSSPTPQVKSWRPFFNFAKGACRFSDLCRYVHDANARTGNNNNGSNTRGRGTVDASHTTNELLTKLLQQLGSMDVNSTAPSPTNNPPVVAFHTGNNTSRQSRAKPLLFRMPLRPRLFKTRLVVRRTWTQFVRDNNCTIEFDAFGFSVKDFTTRRVLLRCDSIGDLYPVTAPSPIPHAFLKPPVLCHACQLGKHVRLPFVSSNIVISSYFDIIHSDVWTSPIPSLSGFKYYVLIVMKRYGTKGPTDDYERVFWENLKTMFDAPLSTDLVWSLPERKYPLSANVCQTMLKMKLLDGKMNEDLEERRVWVLANHHTTNGHQFTMSNRHKDWLVQEQTALGKDFSNPFMADNLPKIIWLSTHHIYVCKELASPQGYGLCCEVLAMLFKRFDAANILSDDFKSLIEVKNLFIQENHQVAVQE
ncbi:ribonuclease H-like domain-containing protein [Tanacetum coccineum]